MSQLPGLPTYGAAGFRQNRIIAAILATGDTGNRIVIGYDPGTSTAYVLFFTGAAGEVPGSISSFLGPPASSVPVLDIRSGTRVAGRQARLQLAGTDPGGTTQTSALLIADTLRINATTAFLSMAGATVGALVGGTPQIGSTEPLITGSPRSGQPWRIDAGETSAATNGAGDITITASSSFAGIAAILATLSTSPVPGVLSRQSTFPAGATFRVFDLAGAPQAGVPVSVSWAVIGY